ncbi:hypothetical protein Droror1_Dr00001630 [Drosera rotundifolia]
MEAMTCELAQPTAKRPSVEGRAEFADGHNAESRRSSSGFPISSSRDETGSYPVGKTLFDESALKQMGLTPEMIKDQCVRQREKACRAAVDLENRRRGACLIFECDGFV